MWDFKILLLIFFILIAKISKADFIALTFDDLPIQSNSKDPRKEYLINKKILDYLEKHHAPAIGFVKESGIFFDDNFTERVKSLKLWADKGFELGNHSYSHFTLSQTDLDQYQEDVLKGEKISKPIMKSVNKEYKYFRHPYLDTGGSKEKREKFEKFLKEKGYIIAPITMDFNDWRFNAELLTQPKNKDQIIKNYLSYAETILELNKQASIKIFGRNIKHIALLHLNLLNSLALDDLLNLIESYNYEFISLDDAMKDKAYCEKDEYYEAHGVSWLVRYAHTKNIPDINWR